MASANRPSSDQPQVRGRAEARDGQKPIIEPELLQIFTEEACQYLDFLEDRISGCVSEQSGLAVNAELLRVLHTLKGGARTVSLPGIANLCELLERYAKAQNKATSSIPYEALTLYGEVTRRIRETLSSLHVSDAPIADTEVLEHKLRQMLEGKTYSNGEAHSLDECLQSTSTGIEEVLGKKDSPESTVSSGISVESEASEPDRPSEQDAELVEVYLEESSELLDTIDDSLETWRHNPANQTLVNEMQRLLHTLKGGARMAGFSNIGDLSHAIESLIVATTSARIVCDARFFELLQLALDRLHLMQDEAQNGQPVYPASDVIAVLDGTRKGDSRRTTESPSAPRRSNRLAEPAARRSLQDEVDARSPDSVETEPKHSCSESTALHAKGSKTQGSGTKKVRNNAQSSGNPAQDLVRIRSELMDRLVNDAGEVNIYHDRLGQQISAFGFNLKELDQTVLRLRHQLRNLELETEAQILFRYEKDITKKDEDFDPLELDRYSTIQQLSRALSESVSDLVSIQEILTSLMRDTETLLLQQSRVSTELQESLMRTRMLRFSVLAPRLRRIARQTAKELNKKVELTLGGESNELDRSVLDKIVAPLEHMLRNAISHGIESTGQRQLNKKPAIGMIHIEVSREASEVVIRVQDDGAGIDLERVRDKARSRGFINEDDNLSDHDVMQFILESGFSTADEVTQISGRGVGLDVVNNEIKELRGVLSIQSTLGKGTVFEVRLPFTLAINKALLVQSGDDLYAIQLTSIEGIIRLTSDELKQRYAQSNPIYEYAENAYELKHLGSLLGMTQPAFTDSHTLFPILLVRSGDLRVALQVEGLLGSREVVVKSVGAKIGKVRGISGATILGDGRVILILDIPGLIRMGAGARFTTSAKQHADQSKPLSAAKVMVVDDSITIRKVTSRMLERNSFEVMTAKDGVDAIGQLQEQTPDLFLLDIEMPRMDGFELASHIRNNQRLKQVPIIMITSRTGEKHRQKAMQMGVNRYLGKPYKESELLANIREILDQQGTLPQVTSSL